MRALDSEKESKKLRYSFPNAVMLLVGPNANYILLPYFGCLPLSVQSQQTEKVVDVGAGVVIF